MDDWKTTFLLLTEGLFPDVFAVSFKGGYIANSRLANQMAKILQKTRKAH